MLAFGHIFCSYLLAFVYYITFEGPIERLRQRASKRIRYGARKLRAHWNQSSITEGKKQHF